MEVEHSFCLKAGLLCWGAITLIAPFYPLVTTNVLTNLAAAPLAGSGFSTPLGAGSYTINVQQTVLGISFAVVGRRGK